MIVNSEVEKRLFIWVTMLTMSFCATQHSAVAADAAHGWEGSTPDPQASEEERKTPKSPDPVVSGQTEVKPNSQTRNDPRSQGWNEDARRGATEAAATTRKETGSLYTAGDTALNAGQYADAARSLDEAWRTTTSGAIKIDGKTTALFFERRAIATRGTQRLADAERLLKQAIGHATTGGIKDPEVYGRILFSLADIQSQEGLPVDSLTAVKQAAAALSAPSASAPSNQTAILLVELMNIEGRSLAEIGDLQTAETKLSEALSKCASLPGEASNAPPQGPLSKYSEYLKGKIKINQYYVAAIKGDAAKAMPTLEEGLAIITRYAPGMAPDTRYSATILSAEKANFSQESLQSALADASRLPGEDNLIKAALLQQQSVVKERGDDYKSAAEAIKAAFDIRTKALPANSLYMAETLIQTASLSAGQGRASEAAAHAQRASSSLERSTGRGSIYFARASVELASVYIASNRAQKLEPLLTETVNTFTKVRGADDPETIHATDLLCSTFVRNNKYAVTIKYSEPNLAAGEKRFGPNSLKLVMTLNNLGVANSHLKNFEKANGYLQRAQNILARAGKSRTADFAELLASAGVNYTLQKKWGPAEIAFKQAKAIYTTAYGARSPHVEQMNSLLSSLQAHKNPRNPADFNLMMNKFQTRRPDFR